VSAQFIWFDLAVDDSGKAREFYTELFGWPVGPGMGSYQGWFSDGDQPWAGITPATPATAGRWVPYVVVEDLDTAAKQAVALGGTVVADKTVGPAGTSVTIADPGGAVIALFKPAAEA
jgi:predicted enzyme related to lactoylglutathione lyase